MEKQTQPSRCVGIVGLGLIGGSLGLDLQSLGWKVNGLVHRTSTVNRAKARGLAQLISTDPTILSECDLVILALPLKKLLNPSRELINSLPKSAVVTDVGSVKAPVLKVWRDLHPLFIASHPMAGTAQAGVESGQHGLFQKRPWISTPETKTNSKALEIVNQLATSLGSQWITSSAEKHDQAVALISHLPVIISAALLRTLGEESDPTLSNLARILASSGFADTTRVGSGNPQLGTDMAANNTSALLKALTSFHWSLKQLEGNILAENWEQLHTELERTKSLRPSFLCEEV